MLALGGLGYDVGCRRFNEHRPQSASASVVQPHCGSVSLLTPSRFSRCCRFPKAQWKTFRTTNTIERLHEDFRRRVKTQGSLPTEDAALVLLFSLVASGQ